MSLRRLTKLIFLFISSQFDTLIENSSIFPVTKKLTSSYEGISLEIISSS